MVDGTDIILTIDLGRQIFDFAMLSVIREASIDIQREINRGGDRVLHDSEIPWEFYKQGLLITATTYGPEPRILTWDVLAASLHGLFQCGYYKRHYREMSTSIWDMEARFYGDLTLQNRSPHAVQ